MSYILDALQKSQRERELGQVPTVGSVPYAGSSGSSLKPNPWILGSLVTALAALGIGLYAILGDAAAPPPLEQPAPAVAPSLPTTPPVKAASAVEPAAVRSSDKPPAVAPTKAPEKTVVPPPSAARPEPAPSQTKPQAMEAPAPSLASMPQPVSEEPEQADLQALQERMRQANDTGQTRQDLRQEVETFKRRLAAPSATSSASDTPPAPLPEAVPAPTPSNATAPPFKVLHPTLQQRIPAFNLSVHVYADEPRKRFVILNSRRMGEGETNPDGLTLETISSEGVELSFEGIRFFHPR